MLLTHWFLFFSLLFTPLFAASSSWDTVPVLYEGRFRPFKVAADLWFENLHGRGGDYDPTDLALKLNLYRNQSWDQAPLFKVNDHKLKKLLNLPQTENHFSYQMLHQALYENPTTSRAAFTPLLINAFFQSRQKGKRKELPHLAPGLILLYQRERLMIESNWNHFSPGDLLGQGSPKSLLKESRRSVESVQELLHKMNRFSQLTRAGETDQATLSSVFAFLPNRYEPGSWLPLQALKERNMTPYSTLRFQKIRKAYLADDLDMLAKELKEGYTSLAGTPYRKTANEALVYPTLGQLRAELWAHQLPLIPIICGLYAFALLLFLLRKRRLSYMTLLAAFAVHTALLVLRIYVLQRPPVSNMFETVIYVPWVAVLVALLSRQRSLYIASVGVSATLLLILQGTQLASSMENVQAVLNSQYWLTIHVLMVVGSYGLFALSSILGHAYLILNAWHKRQSETKKQLSHLILNTLYIGTALLIGGTILGGVWAAQSWGRFWDWDPKESWAFISSCTYIIWIHLYRFRYIEAFGLAIGSIVGFLSISFTWYGVNYILGTGLHSYGFGSGGEGYYFLYLLLEALFIFGIVVLQKSPLSHREQ